MYSSLFRFFPRFSRGPSRAAPSVHNRRGSPKSVVDEDGIARSTSPVRSMASISSNGDVAGPRSDRSGVVLGRILLRDDVGGS